MDVERQERNGGVTPHTHLIQDWLDFLDKNGNDILDPIKGK